MFSAHIPTTPGYASMLTGRDCFGTDVVALAQHAIVEGVPVLAEILRDQGYNTTCVGFEGNAAGRGYDKYISKTIEVVGQSYSAALRMAENNAKLGIAADMGTLVQSLAQLNLANKEISPEQAVSVSQSVEKVKLIVNGKLGRVITSTTLYKMNRDVYRVRVTVLYSQEAALQAAQAAAQQALKEGMKVNDAEFDALFGYDKLRDQYVKSEWDETIQ